MQQHPGIEISWDRRSLFSFGEGEMADIATAYDLVLFDHPFIGEIARTGVFLDLSDHLSPDEFAAFERDSLGPSFASYLCGSQLFALPIDAAAQVSLYRPDLVKRADLSLPNSIDDISDFAQRASKGGLKVITPLKQIDVLCLLFTLSATRGGPVQPGECFLERGLFEECAALLKMLARISAQGSTQINPIEAYERMKRSDDIVYCPYSFGYSNYARLGADPLVLAVDCPPDARSGLRASCIGGVGIGVTSQSKVQEQAIAYAKFLCEPGYQSSFYVSEGGQPASRSAWLDAKANAMSHGFFANTFATLDTAYLRPRFPGFMDFAREAGPIVVAMIEGDISVLGTMDKINDAYARAQAHS